MKNHRASNCNDLFDDSNVFIKVKKHLTNLIAKAKDKTKGDGFKPTTPSSVGE